MFFCSQKLTELTGADCFILALSRMMKRQGNHGHVGQTHLRLEGIPDIAALCRGAVSFGEANPLLDAFVRRNPLTLIPSWRIGRKPSGQLLPNLWHEKGAVRQTGIDSSEIESAQHLAEELLNRPLDGSGGVRNLRLDLILLQGGGSTLLLTWNHLLFDGKGAELLVGYLMEAMNGSPSIPQLSPPEPNLPIKVQLEKAKPAVDRFFNLIGNQYRCLANPQTKAGKLRYRLLHFSQEESEAIRQRAVDYSGLFSVGFYLACAARAHRQVFLSRREDPTHYVSSIPVQVRKKGGRKDPFQNRVTVLFFSLMREDLESLQTASQVAMVQFEELTRLDLGTSFSMILRLMRRLPSLFYMRFLGTQFSGNITSFFHSATGPFAVELDECCGTRIIDAYHIPSVSAPPGSGLFFGESHGRLIATFTWREGAATEAEANLVLETVTRDLLGAPSPCSR